MGRYPHIRAWAALSEADVEAVNEAMELTGVADLADRAISSLSGGERQRASIAAALAQGGAILLLDEPTSFLDFHHQVQILDLLDRLHAEQGLTVVAVTHDLNSTVVSSDSVVALKDGAVAATGTPGELLDADVLAHIYDTEFRLVAGGYRGLPVVLPARNGS
jgi:iron complex transport system ATP-binding protein